MSGFKFYHDHEFDQDTACGPVAAMIRYRCEVDIESSPGSYGPPGSLEPDPVFYPELTDVLLEANEHCPEESVIDEISDDMLKEIHAHMWDIYSNGCGVSVI